MYPFQETLTSQRQFQTWSQSFLADPGHSHCCERIVGEKFAAEESTFVPRRLTLQVTQRRVPGWHKGLPRFIFGARTSEKRRQPHSIPLASREGTLLKIESSCSGAGCRLTCQDTTTKKNTRGRVKARGTTSWERWLEMTTWEARGSARRK